MKKLCFLFLTFLGVQVLAGIVVPLALNLPELLHHEPADLTRLARDPAALAITLLLTNVVTLAVVYAWGLLPALPKGRAAWSWLWAVLLFVPVMVLANILSEQLALTDYMAPEFTLLKNNALAIVCMALVGPLTEEVVFRLGMTGQLLAERRPLWLCLGLPALLFALIHANPAQMPGAFVLGLTLGWVFVRTRSLWPCVGLHVLNNSLALVLMNYDESATFSGLLGSQSALVAVVAACAVMAALFLFLFNRTTRS